jgi:pimeloyl-ACP methyl ester carboxylesterase
MVDEEVLARRCFKIKKREIVRPTVLSEEDWQRLAVPTLFLVGRNDVSYSAERAVKRLAAVAPHIKTAITDGDHHLTITPSPHHHETGLGDPARSGVPRRSLSRLAFDRA